MNSLISRGSENGLRNTLNTLYSSGLANTKNIKDTMTITMAVPFPFLIKVESINANEDRNIIGNKTCPTIGNKLNR